MDMQHIFREPPLPDIKICLRATIFKWKNYLCISYCDCVWLNTYHGSLYLLSHSTFMTLRTYRSPESMAIRRLHYWSNSFGFKSTLRDKRTRAWKRKFIRWIFHIFHGISTDRTASSTVDYICKSHMRCVKLMHYRSRSVVDTMTLTHPRSLDGLEVIFFSQLVAALISLSLIIMQALHWLHYWFHVISNITVITVTTVQSRHKRMT